MRRLVRTNHTLLLVCEGYAEIELAGVLRDCFLPRDCGTALSTENARGSASRALDIALQRQQESVFDTYGVLIDTDEHWDDSDRRRAHAAGIVCMENSPCLEATLLTAAGHQAHPNTRENKQEFERIFGAPAHRSNVIARNFSADVFTAARGRVEAIGRILDFLRR